MITPDFDSADDVVQALMAEHRKIPQAALAAAEIYRADLVDEFLQLIDDVLDDPEGTPDEDAGLLTYAVYLLAKWGETRALPGLLELLALPGDVPFDLLGDIPTEDGPAILAGVSDGRIEPFDELIRDVNANEYGRTAALFAIAALGLHGRIPLDDVEEYVAQLVESGLERQPSHVWDVIALISSELAFTSTLPGLRRAFEEGWIDEDYIRPEDVEKLEQNPQRDPGLLERAEYEPITDVAESISWWGQWSEPATGSRIGRNDPCPCGSGKKYKKCHGA